MPEIKHNFTSGKMNKDLDERLVPNGEYRHAENIQVSTSDGSDVGAVQNILGNLELPGQTIPRNSTCVGSIADEKNNKLYYFIAALETNIISNGNFSNGNIYWETPGSLSSIDDGLGRAMLGITFNGGSISDQPRIEQLGILSIGKTYKLTMTVNRFHQTDPVSFGPGYIYDYLVIDNGGVNVTIVDHEIQSGNTVVEVTWLADTTDLVIAITPTEPNIPEYLASAMLDNISVVEVSGDMIIEYDTETELFEPVIVDLNSDVLKFNPANKITGINIVDDMLIWTDGYYDNDGNILGNEPKKINIKRCKQGTSSTQSHTKLINEAQGYNEGSNNLIDIQEHHITVAKKQPLSSPGILYETFRPKDKEFSAYMTISDGDANSPNDFLNSSVGRIHNFNFLSVGDTFRTYIHAMDGSPETILEWKQGEEVVLKEFDENGEAPHLPITDYRIKGTITNWGGNSFTTADSTINENGNLQNGSNGWPHNWSYNYAGKFAWEWTGDKLKCRRKRWMGTHNQKHAYSVLTTGIKNARDYQITFTVGQLSPGDQGNWSVPAGFEGKLEVFLRGDEYTGGLGPLMSTKIIDINNGFGTYSYTVTFDGTTPSNATPVYKNSIIFKATQDANGDFFVGTIDNVKVVDVALGTDSAVEIRINSIEGTPPEVENGIDLRYAIDLFDKEEKLFEFKFPRFAYRYKYTDNEYSTFSPFSQIVFVPGTFNYHPRQGYNLGMTNSLKSITLTGFLSNIPNDVISVDILYKEEDSPNIYIVDTIKDLSKIEYIITSETLKNGLTASNQLLRHWDNVPRRALTQEVVGSRIVYGNYLQNYNLIDNITNNNYYVDLIPEMLSFDHKNSHEGITSIKSLREYQVGVVYADKYGRQTPILTNEDATIKLSKNKAGNINQLRISIGNEGHPINMEYFKFYIKENSGQYYNIAMDRYYDAEDDNIWLAFPSSDRNKVEIDDFLILKKGVGSDELIKDAARYKVIDIKNEAPDHIKRNEFLIATKRHSDTNQLFKASDLPTENDTIFSINYAEVSNSSYSNLHNDFNNRVNDKYFISISNNTTKKVTDRYELIALNSSSNDPNVTPDAWNFTLKKPFSSEINDFTDDTTGDNSSIILNDSYLNIYKSTIDNSPKFDGRFFVKIYNDDVFTRNIKEGVDGEINVEYRALPNGDRKIYGLETEVDTDRIKRHFNTTTKANEVFYGASTDATNNPPSLSKAITPAVYGPWTSWAHYINSTNKVGEHIGTLNTDGSWSGMGDQYASSRWMHYDAYFRAFNMAPNGINQRKQKIDIHGADAENQAYEDVWFIDKGRTAGSFENSNNSPSSGWDSTPNSNNGTGIGTRNYTNKSRIELAFGGIQPPGESDDLEGFNRNIGGWPTITGAIVRTPKDIRMDRPGTWTLSDPEYIKNVSFYDLENSNTNYSSTQGPFVKHLAVGSQFRFKEDPNGTIYTIEDVDIYFKVRYEDITTGLEGKNDLWKPSLKDFNQNASGDLRATKGRSFILQAAAKNGLKVLGDSSASANEPYIINNHYGSTTVPVVNAIYKTSTFFRASNFTKNYRLWLDKELDWDPFQDTAGELTNGAQVKVTCVDSSHGENFIDVTSLTADASVTYGGSTIYDAARRVELGMVLDTAPNGNAIPVDALPMVSEIEFLNPNWRIKFKNYNGTHNLTANGNTGSLSTIGSPTSSATVTFKQYPMNGLSPNSAKNKNYFFGSVGFDNSFDYSGTDALGYTIEFVEAKTLRPDENVVPENPAVWETEPKKLETDLDVYYAASDFKSINISNISEFIPIGSRIEHENSNAIPPGTIITNIDENGQITLSSDILIDPNNLPTHPDGSEPTWGSQGV